MEKISFALGAVCKAVLDVGLAALLLRTVADVFLRKGNHLNQMLFFVTEIIVLPVRLAFAKLRFFEKSPIDVAFFASFFLLSSLELIFGTWF